MDRSAASDATSRASPRRNRSPIARRTKVTGGPPPDRATGALNTALPDEVAVVAADRASDGFHARFDARARSYRYRVFRRRERSPFEAGRALWWPRPIDLEALRPAPELSLAQADQPLRTRTAAGAA